VPHAGPVESLEKSLLDGCFRQESFASEKLSIRSSTAAILQTLKMQFFVSLGKNKRLGFFFFPASLRVGFERQAPIGTSGKPRQVITCKRSLAPTPGSNSVNVILYILLREVQMRKANLFVLSAPCAIRERAPAAVAY